MKCRLFYLLMDIKAAVTGVLYVLPTNRQSALSRFYQHLYYEPRGNTLKLNRQIAATPMEPYPSPTWETLTTLEFRYCVFYYSLI